MKDLLAFLIGDNLSFYKELLEELTEEELQRFLEANPDFVLDNKDD